MRILIDIGHPAHVHLFKYFASEMKKKGNEVLFTARSKESEIYLLEKYNLPFKSFGRHYKTRIGKIIGLFKFNILMLGMALKFKPDYFISHGSIYAAHIAWLLHKKHISLEDTGNMEQVRLYLPFTSVVLTSNCFHKNLGKKQLKYHGYHELAYLHPNRYKKNTNIRNLLGIQDNKPYIILRFVSWNATHDKGQNGLSEEYKLKLVATLEKKAVLLISSENKLPDLLLKYQILLSPEKMHDVLADASLFIGEGATMASECAVLGTPVIYINSMEAGTIDEQEKYGLIYHFRSSEGVIEKALDLLNIPTLKADFKQKRAVMLKDKIDVTAFLVWFVENYPESDRVIRKTPTYQNRFK